jgi:hypothetical protein
MTTAEKTEAAWAHAKSLRTMLEQTLNREQRRELQDLLSAWRYAHLADVMEIGGPAIERIARELLSTEP